MRSLVARIERLQRLAAFEAAARLGTFTAAARELGVTQPGVTRHVRALEAGLGVVLFERSANRAALTPAGQRLHTSVAAAFDTLEAGLAELAPRAGEFVLAANPGIAERWLVPGLAAVQNAIGDRDLRLWLFDRNAELAQGRFDAAIHAGDGRWSGCESRLLFPEIVVPVATPELALRHGLDSATPPTALLGLDLLHLDETDRPWMSWRTWFGHFGLEAPSRASRVSYNNYALVLQHVIAGQGVALAWRYLIDDLLAHDVLVPVGPEVRHASAGYYLIWPERSRDDAVPGLLRWLEQRIGCV